MGKHDPMKDHPEIIALKERAKQIRIIAPNLSASQAIEVAAREKFFGSYAAFRESLKKVGQ